MPDYNNAIPQPNDILSDSQDDILENFQQLALAWNVNHAPFNSMAPPQGVHTQITLPEIPNTAIAAPTPTAIDTANIYSQQSAVTGVTELVWQRENNGAIIEWTTRQQIGGAGWTRLPSGIVMKWQNLNITALQAANGNIVASWAGIGPVFNPQFFALVNPAADPANINKDVNCIAYITDLTNPAQVSFKLWRRNLFNTLGTDQGPLNVNIFAIGA